MFIAMSSPEPPSRGGAVPPRLSVGAASDPRANRWSAPVTGAETFFRQQSAHWRMDASAPETGALHRQPGRHCRSTAV